MDVLVHVYVWFFWVRSVKNWLLQVHFPTENKCQIQSEVLKSAHALALRHRIVFIRFTLYIAMMTMSMANITELQLLSVCHGIQQSLNCSVHNYWLVVFSALWIFVCRKNYIVVAFCSRFIFWIYSYILYWGSDNAISSSYYNISLTIK